MTDLTVEPATTAATRSSERPFANVAPKLAGALRSSIKGEVRFTDGDRALYAYDGSIYRQVPIGVVVPKDEADVEAALAVCREYDVPILGRGCGTSLAGQCCNAAVVFDFSKHMHGIVEPDPQTHDHCTLGGMIGNNSCGTHSLTSGKTVDNTERLEILTYDGLRLSVGATGEAELEEIIREGGRRGEIYARLKALRDRYGELVRTSFPKIPRRVSGYNLDALLPENGFDVAKALVGTESTCVLVLEGTMRLVRNPPKHTIVVIGFPDIPSSGDIVTDVLKYRPIGTEFFAAHVVENIAKKKLPFINSAGLLPDG